MVVLKVTRVAQVTRHSVRLIRSPLLSCCITVCRDTRNALSRVCSRINNTRDTPRRTPSSPAVKVFSVSSCPLRQLLRQSNFITKRAHVTAKYSAESRNHATNITLFHARSSGRKRERYFHKNDSYGIV